MLEYMSMRLSRSRLSFVCKLKIRDDVLWRAANRHNEGLHFSNFTYYPPSASRCPGGALQDQVAGGRLKELHGEHVPLGLRCEERSGDWARSSERSDGCAFRAEGLRERAPSLLPHSARLRPCDSRRNRAERIQDAHYCGGSVRGD